MTGLTRGRGAAYNVTRKCKLVVERGGYTRRLCAEIEKAAKGRLFQGL